MNTSHISPLKQRLAGVLLHPSSLPSGKIDQSAYHWLDFMHSAGLRVWQMLPLGVPQANRSPYQCFSAFAINPALFTNAPTFADVDANFSAWFEQQRYWLEDYALFSCLRAQHHNAPWFEWDEEYKQRQPAALAEFKRQQQVAIETVFAEQYHAYQQWQQLRDYAQARGIYLFGDMPIFVAHDSADVWAHQNCFLLDDNGQPTQVTGVPPDYFSETGQRWGNPHYHWDMMQASDFHWWRDRLKNHFQWFDLVRIDHFRGLQAAWMIDASAETAIDGYWQTVPGDALLASVEKELGHLPLVAEDLGVITPEVVTLRKKYHLPGMAVLQFAFDHFADNPHKPENIQPDCVVYTGTHDNDTTQGWFESLSEQERTQVFNRLGEVDNLPQALMQTALASEANLAIMPLQDLLGLGSDARMNIPGISEDNWQWQFSWDAVPETLAATLKQQLIDNRRN